MQTFYCSMYVSYILLLDATCAGCCHSGDMCTYCMGVLGVPVALSGQGHVVPALEGVAGHALGAVPGCTLPEGVAGGVWYWQGSHGLCIGGSWPHIVVMVMSVCWVAVYSCLPPWHLGSAMQCQVGWCCPLVPGECYAISGTNCRLWVTSDGHVVGDCV